MSEHQLIFDLLEEMPTSDNYHVQLKGFVEASEAFNKDDLLSAVKKSCRSHLSKISLMDALDLVNPEQSAPIRASIVDYADIITTFEISTVDAVEVQQATMVEVSIDPDLENQSQSKGVLGKIKSIFRR